MNFYIGQISSTKLTIYHAAVWLEKGVEGEAIQVTRYSAMLS